MVVWLAYYRVQGWVICDIFVVLVRVPCIVCLIGGYELCCYHQVYLAVMVCMCPCVSLAQPVVSTAQTCQICPLTAL